MTIAMNTVVKNYSKISAGSTVWQTMNTNLI